MTKKHVVIKSNDDVNQETVVTLIAEIIQELKVTSHPGGVVNLGKLKKDVRHRETITVQNMADVPLQVQNVRVNGKTLTVSLEPATIQPGETIDILLEVIPDTPGMIRQESLTLTTDSKNQPRTNIKVVYSS